MEENKDKQEGLVKKTRSKKTFVIGGLAFLTILLIVFSLNKNLASKYKSGRPTLCNLLGEQKTIKGKIDKISDYGPKYGILLDTGDNKIFVQVGPTWYITEQKIVLKENDNIEVNGNIVTPRKAKPFLIAKTIKKGNTSYTLRDKDAYPKWANRKYRKDWKQQKRKWQNNNKKGMGQQRGR